MIEFPCPCGRYTFSVPEDMAGGLVQCPKCGRLNDIPTLSDLALIAEDGTYKVVDAVFVLQPLHRPEAERSGRPPIRTGREPSRIHAKRDDVDRYRTRAENVEHALTHDLTRRCDAIRAMEL